MERGGSNYSCIEGAGVGVLRSGDVSALCPRVAGLRSPGGASKRILKAFSC